MNMKNKKGFTLIEATFVLALVGGISVINAKTNSNQSEQLHAKAMGKEVYEYNMAVNRYLAELSDSLTQEDKELYSQNVTGTKWLKASDCEPSGTASSGFLSCQSLPADRTIYGNSKPATNIFYANGDLRAKTSWSMAQFRGRGSESMMGLSALVATGSYLHIEDTVEQEGSTVFCPDISSYDEKMQVVCEGSRGKMISFASASASAGVATGTGSVSESDLLDQYLSVDGKNSMRNIIEFNETGEATDQSAIPNFDNSTLRQIVNVARIFNIGESGSDSLILGNYLGESLYTSDFVTSNNLLKNHVIVDGGLAVYGGAIVNGDLRAQAISAGRLITSKIETADISISGSLYADTAEIDTIRSYGDIEIKEGNLNANALDVTGDANFSGTMRVAGGLNAETITTNTAAMQSVHTSHLSVTNPIKYSAIKFEKEQVTIGNSCSINGTLTSAKNSSTYLSNTLAICSDGKWIEAVKVTGGIKEGNILEEYPLSDFYDRTQFRREVSMDTYYSYAYSDSTIADTIKNLKCSADYSFIVYTGSGKFQCITT